MANRDRILHQVQRWEDLLDLGDTLLELPPDATPEEPLQVYISREVLQAVLEVSIAAIHANQDALDTAHDLKAETVQLFRQRERFLAWVMRHPKPNIYVALYPKSEFELVGDEGDEPAGDDAGNPDPTDAMTGP